MDASGGRPPTHFLGPRTGLFVFSRVRCRLAPERELSLPDPPGLVLRGALGRSLREVSCVTGRDTCNSCSHIDTCAYGHAFETPLAPDERGRLSSPFAPHPFVLGFPEPGGRRSRVSELSIDLTLIGRGREHLATFLEAIRRMGEAGIGPSRRVCRLVAVEDLALDSGTSPGSGARTAAASDLSDPAPSRARLSTLSPLRLVDRGDPSDGIDPGLLMRALFRRIGALARFHCGFEPEVPYGGLLDMARGLRVTSSELAWVDSRRYSARQRRRTPLGGVAGSIILEGDLDPFWPFLKLGEIVHVGKGTAFGLGRYRMTSEEGTLRDDPGHAPRQP